MKPSSPHPGRHSFPRSSRRILLALFLMPLLAVSVAESSTSATQATGMVCDDGSDSAVVFDADTGGILGVLELGATVAGCAVTRDGTLGVIAGGVDGVWIVDLSAEPPALASGPNPVDLRIPATSVALDPGDSRVVACGADTIAVVDLATRRATATLPLPDGCSDLDICVDGSVLVASEDTGVLRRFSLDDAGRLSATGDALSIGDADVSCGAGALSGAVVERDTRTLRTFAIPGLAVVDERALPGTSFGFVDRNSNWIYTVSEATPGTASIEAYALDPTTAYLGEQSVASMPAPAARGARLGIHPEGTRLFAATPGRIVVYDSLGGPPIASTSHPALVSPTDVCLPLAPEGGPDMDGDGIPDDEDNCPTVPNPTEHFFDFETGSQGWTHVSLGGTDSWRIATSSCLGDSYSGRAWSSAGNYGPFCNPDSTTELSQLIGPVIDEPAWPDLFFSFSSRSFDEAGTCTQSLDADAKDVGISTDGAASYDLLNDCTPLGDEVGTAFPFQYDISQYLGQPIQAVFVYDTGDQFFGHTFSVDNIRFFTTSTLDFDGDGDGDACDSCTDTDGDGFGNPGFPVNTCGTDNCPTTPNPQQGDSDDDVVGNLCDNCPLIFNTDQLDADGDGDGDRCDMDADDDGILNVSDNCPTIANVGQEDVELDGVGDPCDNCPADSNSLQTDVDKDGLGDACDDCTDTDGDGYGLAGDACFTDNCPDLANPNQSNADGALYGSRVVIEPDTSSGRVFAVDVDGDGDQDVFTGGGRVLCFRCFNGSPPAWHENLDGLGTFGPRQELSVITATPTFPADINGDGAVDLFSASGGFMFWYENDGDGNFQRFTISDEIAIHGIARALEAVDLDGDDDMDVVVAGYDDEPPFSDKVYWFENLDGAGTFGDINFITEAAGGPRSVTTADFDGDGDMDVMTGGFVDGVVGWYENVDGEGTFGPGRRVLEVGTRIDWVAALDIDGDGDVDALSADSFGDRVTWYRRESSGIPWTAHTISATLDAPIFVDATDVDQDGDPDVMAVAFNDQAVVWFENTDGLGTFGPERQVGTINGVTSVTGGDINGDGGIDFIAGSVTAAGLDFPFGTTDWIPNVGGDPAGDDCDCDDADPTIYNNAPELNDGIDNQCAGDVGFGAIDETSGNSGFLDAGDDDRYSWPAQAGATLYEAARSSTPQFSAPCLLFPSSADTFVVDAATPNLGEVFYYLNRPLEPNLGSWGTDSSGVERTVACTP